MLKRKCWNPRYIEIRETKHSMLVDKALYYAPVLLRGGVRPLKIE